VSKSRVLAPREGLAALCRKRHIRKLSFFGSVLREDFGPQSDVDVLVEYEPGHALGLESVDIQEELSALLGGRQVDMVNPKYLNRWLKDRVLASAEVQYAQE